MRSLSDFPAGGTILRVESNTAVFQPTGSTYELHLELPKGFIAEAGQRIHCVIRLQARKLYSVPSGGNFITPIAGPPRIVQGRVRYLNDDVMVIHAAVPIVVELPKDKSAYDLGEGPLAAGVMVNVTAVPGAAMLPLAEPVARR